VGHVSRRQACKTRAYDRIYRQLIINTFSQSDALWERVLGETIRFRPALAVGYVSSLEQFAKFLIATGRSVPRLRAVIAAAEPLFPAVRQTIEQGFQAPVFNTYGSREFMSVAAECPQHDGLHVHAENLVVETEQPSGEVPSQILVTDLHNYGMPFIRYVTGDLGTMTVAACPCGRRLPRLKSVEGRLLDALQTADGRVVPGEFFPHLLKDVPELVRYRVEQTRIDHIVISAVLARPISEASRMLLEREIGKVFGSSATWELVPVPDITPLASGKHRVTVGLAASSHS